MEDYKKFLENMRYNPKLLRCYRAKRRFRALVRHVLHHLYWLQHLEKVEGYSDNVHKNVRMIISRKKAEGSVITNKERQILLKTIRTRTKKDKEYLANVFSFLEMFMMYPENVRRNMAAVTKFLYFRPGKIIVKQGHNSVGMYFILSGIVDVIVTKIDPVLRTEVTEVVGELSGGSKFGEVALLHNIPRTATIRCQKHCEFLYVEKKHFDRILKHTLLDEWAQILECLSLFSYFDNWSSKSKRDFCVVARRKMYKPGETIVGDNTGFHFHAYFIVKGTCSLIQHLLLRPYYKNGQKHYKLFDPNQRRHKVKSKDSLSKSYSRTDYLFYLRTKRTESQTTVGSIPKIEDMQSNFSISPKHLPEGIESHFLQVCVFTALGCFNVGENFEHRRVIALTDVETLSVPRHLLLQHNDNNLWNHVKCYLNRTIPNTREIYNDFLQMRAWEAYKKKLVKNISQNIKIHNSKNTINNVPYSIRVKQEIYQ